MNASCRQMHTEQPINTEPLMIQVPRRTQVKAPSSAATTPSPSSSPLSHRNKFNKHDEMWQWVAFRQRSPARCFHLAIHIRTSSQPWLLTTEDVTAAERETVSLGAGDQAFRFVVVHQDDHPSHPSRRVDVILRSGPILMPTDGHSVLTDDLCKDFDNVDGAMSDSVLKTKLQALIHLPERLWRSVISSKERDSHTISFDICRTLKQVFSNEHDIVQMIESPPLLLTSIPQPAIAKHICHALHAMPSARIQQAILKWCSILGNQKAEHALLMELRGENQRALQLLVNQSEQRQVRSRPQQEQQQQEQQQQEQERRERDNDQTSIDVDSMLSSLDDMETHV